MKFAILLTLSTHNRKDQRYRARLHYRTFAVRLRFVRRAAALTVVFIERMGDDVVNLVQNIRLRIPVVTL